MTDQTLRVLDLFCGAGGASVGYHRGLTDLGYDVEIVGVDIDPQPNYPFTFVQADATTYPLDGFDLIHASPPCQAYVGWQNIATARGTDNDHPRHIEPLRARLTDHGTPWVIENVVGAPLDGVLLCGTMFGLGVQRHRRFESSELILRPPASCQHTGDEVGVYGKLDGRRLFTRTDGTELRAPTTLEQAVPGDGHRLDGMGRAT